MLSVGVESVLVYNPASPYYPTEAVIRGKVDLRTSVIKPLHFQWLISALSRVKENSKTVQRGFSEAGITSVWCECNTVL